MQAPVKVCPRCGQATALDTPACPTCGHQYRTPFGPTMQPVSNQTQAYMPSAPPRSSFGPTGSAAPPAAPPALCTRCQSPLAPDNPVCRVCGLDQRAPTMPPAQMPAAYPSPVYPAPVYPPPAPPYPQNAYPQQVYAPQQMYAPPGYRPLVPPPVVMHGRNLPYMYPPDDFEMFDLARQFGDSKRLFGWMMVVGLLAFWPLLFVAYSEHKKMNAIKSRVALRGIDPEFWSRAL